MMPSPTRSVSVFVSVGRRFERGRMGWVKNSLHRRPVGLASFEALYRVPSLQDSITCAQKETKGVLQKRTVQQK